MKDADKFFKKAGGGKSNICIHRSMEGPFTKVRMDLIHDSRLSAVAIGIYMYIVSFEGMDSFDEEFIAKGSPKDSIRSIREGLRELVKHGYLDEERVPVMG